MMPYVEPYVTRSTREYFADLDPSLEATARAYVRQETQHHVQHRRFNTMLADRYRGVGHLERVIHGVFELVENHSSPAFNLAFAAGSEAVAYNAARWVAPRHRELFRGSDPGAEELFLWHLAEEVEHKAVAMDVYRACDGSRFRYLRGMLLAFVLLGVFTTVGTVIMTFHERAIWHPRTYWNLLVWSMSYMFEALPNMAASISMDHHPDDMVDPAIFAEWLREMDADAPPDAERGPAKVSSPAGWNHSHPSTGISNSTDGWPSGPTPT